MNHSHYNNRKIVVDEAMAIQSPARRALALSSILTRSWKWFLDEEIYPATWHLLLEENLCSANRGVGMAFGFLFNIQL